MPATGPALGPPGTALAGALSAPAPPWDPEESGPRPTGQAAAALLTGRRRAGPPHFPPPGARAHSLYCAMRCTLALHVWMMPPKSRGGGGAPGR